MGYIEDLRKIIGNRLIILNGSVAIIKNEQGNILMQQRKYPYGKWGLPGGLMELGESTSEVAYREIQEETGLELGELTLLGVYSGKNYRCIASNGDEFYVVTTAYMTSQYTGTLSINDDESLELAWINPYCLPDNIANTHLEILNDYLAKQ